MGREPGRNKVKIVLEMKHVRGRVDRLEEENVISIKDKLGR